LKFMGVGAKLAPVIISTKRKEYVYYGVELWFVQFEISNL